MEHCTSHTGAVQVAMCLEREGREERTGSSSLNVIQVVFICVVVESSQPTALESMLRAKGSYHLQLVRSDLDFPLWAAATLYIYNQDPLSSS